MLGNDEEMMTNSKFSDCGENFADDYDEDDDSQQQLVSE